MARQPKEKRDYKPRDPFEFSPEEVDTAIWFLVSLKFLALRLAAARHGKTSYAGDNGTAALSTSDEIDKVADLALIVRNGQEAT